MNSVSTASRHVEADALPIQPRATLGYRVVRFILKPLLLHCVIRAKVSGLENIPRGPYVAIANHLSWLDGPLLLGSLPASPRVHALGDPGPFMHHRLRWWFVRKVGGLIPVDRGRSGDRVLRDRVVEALALGAPVLIFPEGTCGPREGEMLPFKKGFAHFAKTSQVPIVPIGISGTRSAWLFKRVNVQVGVAFQPADRSVDEIVAEGRQQIQGLLVPDVAGRGPRLLHKQLTSKRTGESLSGGVAAA